MVRGSISYSYVFLLGWEDPLEKGMTTPSGILAWRTPWTIPWGRKELDTRSHFHFHYKKRSGLNRAWGKKAVWRQRQRMEWCCHKPRNVWSHQKLPEVKDPFPELSQGCGCPSISVLDFQHPELQENTFPLFKPLPFWLSATEALEPNTKRFSRGFSVGHPAHHQPPPSTSAQCF